MAPPTTFPDHVLLFLVSVPQRASHNSPSKTGCHPAPPHRVCFLPVFPTLEVTLSVYLFIFRSFHYNIGSMEKETLSVLFITSLQLPEEGL